MVKPTVPLASLALMAVAPASAAELPALLQRVGISVAKADHQMRVLDFTEHSVDEQRTDDGKVLHRIEKDRRVLQAHGKRRQELQKVLQDGKDVTAQARAAAAGRPMDDGGGPHPLMPAEQPKYQFALLPADPAHPTWTHVSFAPKGKGDPSLLEGQAWIDPDTGYLRRVEFHPAAQDDAQKTDVTIEYDQVADGCALQSKMEATIEATPVHQTLHSTVTYRFDVAP